MRNSFWRQCIQKKILDCFQYMRIGKLPRISIWYSSKVEYHLWFIIITFIEVKRYVDCSRHGASKLVWHGIVENIIRIVFSYSLGPWFSGHCVLSCPLSVKEQPPTQIHKLSLELSILVPLTIHLWQWWTIIYSILQYLTIVYLYKEAFFHSDTILQVTQVN